MKILKIKVLSGVFFFCLILTPCKSQDLKKNYIELGSFINTIGLPFKAGNESIKINRPLGIRLSYGHHLNSTENWASNYEIAATFYRQKHLNYSYQIEGNYIYAYQNSNVLAFAPTTSLAYTHTFNDAPTFKKIGNQYIKQKGFGRSQMSIALGFQIQYHLPQIPYSVVAQYQYILQLPFARKGRVWILPQNRIYLGLRRYLDL